MNLPLKKIFLTIYSSFIASLLSAPDTKGSREGTVRISPSPSLTLHLQDFSLFLLQLFLLLASVWRWYFLFLPAKVRIIAAVRPSKSAASLRRRKCPRGPSFFARTKEKAVRRTSLSFYADRQTLKVGTPYPTFFSAQHFLPFVYIEKNARPDVPFVSFFICCLKPFVVRNKEQ